MPSAWEARASIDGDDKHPWTLQVDDFDRANWEGIPLAEVSPGGSTPAEDATCRVTLLSGPHFGHVAPAIFRGTKAPWLTTPGRVTFVTL